MNGTKVDELMTTTVESMRVGETLDLARIIMRIGRIRHLPVVDGEGRVIGLITQRDILRAWVGHTDPARENPAEIAKQIPVDMLMNTDVTTIAVDTPALVAAEIMQSHKYGCLPVVDDGKLVGILTEADFVRFAAGYFTAEADALADS